MNIAGPKLLEPSERRDFDAALHKLLRDLRVSDAWDAERLREDLFVAYTRVFPNISQAAREIEEAYLKASAKNSF
jgi:hypothetical protein